MQPRRQFLATTLATSAAATIPIGSLAAASNNESLASQEDTEARRFVVGIMGLSRGMDLATDLAKMPGVVIKYACDTDKQRLAAGTKRIGEMGQRPDAVGDFRKILDDKEVDALICAAPNHWHGPATILGCKAGKHVYVEKPCSHNPAEGEWMIAAAEKNKRCVQVGTQRRSGISIGEAMTKLHGGVIGKVYLSRAFFQRMRGSIGKKDASTPPDYLNYDLWQGPVPKMPYKENIVHYNWHWFWHYGNGELGNNGIHCLDLCRWGLQVDYPTRIVSSGGRYCYEDDQETPDTHSVAFEFDGKKQITYEGVSCSHRSPGPFVMFYGSSGAMEIDMDGGYKIFDDKNKLVEEVKATGWGQSDHLSNFVMAARLNDPLKLHQPVTEGHKSTLLCHLGNIAHRTQQVVRCDGKTGHILENADQQKLWQREYDSAWEKEITT